MKIRNPDPHKTLATALVVIGATTALMVLMAMATVATDPQFHQEHTIQEHSHGIVTPWGILDRDEAQRRFDEGGQP